MNVGHGVCGSFVPPPPFVTGVGSFAFISFDIFCSFPIFFSIYLAGFGFRVNSWLFAPPPLRCLSLFFTLFSFFPVTSLVGLEGGFLCDKLRNWKWLVVIGVWYILRGRQ